MEIKIKFFMVLNLIFVNAYKPIDNKNNIVTGCIINERYSREINRNILVGLFLKKLIIDFDFSAIFNKL